MNFDANPHTADRMGSVTDPRSPHSDARIYADMETIIQRHIQAALIECSAISRDISCADPVEVMAKMNDQLRWYHVGDLFADAVGAFRDRLCDLGVSYEDAFNKKRITRKFDGPVRVTAP